MSSDPDFTMRVHRETMRKQSRTEAEAIFQLAGLNILHGWELANGYWPDNPSYDDVRTPWWLFLTVLGPIRIGRRKRVIEIDWSACAFRGIVTEDKVTKEDSYVHAWTTEKAVTYLRTLREQWQKSCLLHLPPESP